LRPQHNGFDGATLVLIGAGRESSRERLPINGNAFHRFVGREVAVGLHLEESPVNPHLVKTLFGVGKKVV
jgi:hypothetical protein